MDKFPKKHFNHDGIIYTFNDNFEMAQSHFHSAVTQMSQLEMNNINELDMVNSTKYFTDGTTVHCSIINGDKRTLISSPSGVKKGPSRIFKESRSKYTEGEIIVPVILVTGGDLHGFVVCMSGTFEGPYQYFPNTENIQYDVSLEDEYDDNTLFSKGLVDGNPAELYYLLPTNEIVSLTSSVTHPSGPWEAVVSWGGQVIHNNDTGEPFCDPTICGWTRWAMWQSNSFTHSFSNFDSEIGEYLIGGEIAVGFPPYESTMLSMSYNGIGSRGVTGVTMDATHEDPPCDWDYDGAVSNASSTNASYTAEWPHNHGQVLAGGENYASSSSYTGQSITTSLVTMEVSIDNFSASFYTERVWNESQWAVETATGTPTITCAGSINIWPNVVQNGYNTVVETWSFFLNVNGTEHLIDGPYDWTAIRELFTGITEESGSLPYDYYPSKLRLYNNLTDIKKSRGAITTLFSARTKYNYPHFYIPSTTSEYRDWSYTYIGPNSSNSPVTTFFPNPDHASYHEIDNIIDFPKDLVGVALFGSDIFLGIVITTPHLTTEEITLLGE